MDLRTLSSENRFLLFLWLVSSFIAFAFLRHGDLTFYNDAGSYLSYADYLSRFEFPDGLYFRTPAYPLLIIISGYLATESFTGLLIMQTLIAATIPAIVYGCLRVLSRTIATVGSLIILASFLPYIFELTIYPEQLHIFLSLLFTLLCIRCCLEPDSRIYLLLMYGVLLWLTLSRSTVILLIVFPIIIGLLSGQAAHRRRQWLIHAACLASLLGVHALIDYKKHRDAAVNHRAVRTFNGKQIFYNVYRYADQYGQAFARTNGPASERLRNVMEDFFKDRGRGEFVDPVSGVASSKETLFISSRNVKVGDPVYNKYIAPYLHDPALMTDQVLKKPGVVIYFGTITDIADFVIGVEGDRLLRQVAIEQIMATPSVVWNIFENNVRPFYWPSIWDPNVSIGLSLLLNEKRPSREDHAVKSLSERAKHQLTTRYLVMDQDLADTLMIGWLHALSYTLKTCLMITFIGTLALIYQVARWRSWRVSQTVFLITFGGYVIQSLPIAILSTVGLRYQAAMGALLIPAAVAACALIYDVFHPVSMDRKEDHATKINC